MKIKNLILVLFTSIFFIACGSSSSSSGNNLNGEAKYEITIKGLWTSADFPTNYPSNAHFSPVIGMTHNSSSKLFETGKLASNGIIAVAETGATGTISNEINTFITNKTAQFQVSGNGISTGTGESKFTVSLNTTHPYLSLVSMLVPSPDWFIALNSLNLYDGGKWASTVEKDLVVYDSGSDSGTTFAATNLATNPKENVTRFTSIDNTATDFLNGVHRTSGKHIAKITIKKVN